ncbi:hypothetical protein SELMODRAFT_432338 [Selaginella moellendorffii]|uniref:NADP-dependent glyceraldehyde-3-phosphate dehydrogenase n=1 Tax=Selaginella moellendorffii TaxID=88036 RepID=D8TFP7_SELML|nr:hypothetical protein SELMODRAFT_432338 [Selaginella moellendorffii]
MQHLYMRAGIYKEVKAALIAAFKKLKGGDPHQDDTSIGPVISKSSAAIVEKSMNEAVKAGAKLLVGTGGVCLNDSPSMRVDSQPYGGIKDSAIQREGVKYAMDDMLKTKVLVMRNVGNASYF